ncbi:hypothetical protein MTO96_016087 [Rhipicephalus appendiculatus]
MKIVGTAGARRRFPRSARAPLGRPNYITARARNPALSRARGRFTRGACCAVESNRCLLDCGDENSASMMRVVRLLAAAIVLPAVQNAAVRRSPKGSRHHVSCDWSQGSLSSQPREGVLPVYLSACDSGTVRWSRPGGALRIVLRAQREFQACFRVSADSSGALVYVAQGGLLPGPGLRAKCVLSNRGSVVVYAVATAAANKLILTYTTSQPVASFERLQGWEDCRPCTATELRESYCLSDLVAEATVRNATYHSDQQNIYWWLSVTETHRGRKPDYVTRPARCGFPRDTQEPRLILARWHLGRPVVTCAPKLSQWKRLLVQEKSDRIGELYNVIHWTSAEQNKFKASNGHRLKRRDDSTAANSGTVEEIQG